jgi:hypothetical protein
VAEAFLDRCRIRDLYSLIWGVLNIQDRCLLSLSRVRGSRHGKMADSLFANRSGRDVKWAGTQLCILHERDYEMTTSNDVAGKDNSGVSRESRAPRICMPTFRNFARTPFRCSLYEAQDILADVDDVDMICLEAGERLQSNEQWLRKISYHDVTKRLMFLNPGLQKVRLSRDHDLFVAVCQNYFDILYFNAIEGWRDHCKTSVCWIEEMWASSVPDYKYWLHALSRFDHVFVGCLGSAEPLSRELGRTCKWLPSAVDAIRFSPYPNPPARVIDVYGIGRRWEGTHRALLEAAGRKEIFYVHDTFAAADVETYSPQQHRSLFANMAKRSQFFMVAPAKMNNPEHTHNQVEIGSRYYEGAASGAVMIGQAPDSEVFSDMFPWPDVVIHIRPDGSDVMDVLRTLSADATQLSAISRRNAAEALVRHDWVYRWEELLRTAGVEPTPRLTARKRKLHDLADLVTHGDRNEASAGAVR